MAQGEFVEYAKLAEFRGFVKVKETTHVIGKGPLKGHLARTKASLFVEPRDIADLKCEDYRFDIDGSTGGMVYQMVTDQNQGAKQQLTFLAHQLT